MNSVDRMTNVQVPMTKKRTREPYLKKPTAYGRATLGAKPFRRAPKQHTL